MSNEALETRLKSVLAELKTMIGESGLTKQGDIREMLKRDLKMGQLDAEVLTLLVTQAISEDPLGDLYSGAKAALRPIHERLMAAIGGFGPFEIAPRRPTSACAARSNSPRSGRPPTHASKWE